MRWLTAYLATAAAFVAMDFVWLTQTAAFYQHQLGPLLLDHPRMGPAVLFYLAYLAGVVLFVVAPALDLGRWRPAAWRGAVYGLIAYATYDLTNLASLKGFSLTIAMLDMGWGTVVTGAAATVGYLAASAMNSRAKAAVG